MLGRTLHGTDLGRTALYDALVLPVMASDRPHTGSGGGDGHSAAATFSMADEAHASCASGWTFSWVQRLVSLGYRRPLEIEDLGTLATADHPSVHAQRFEERWATEVAAARARYDATVARGTRHRGLSGGDATAQRAAAPREGSTGHLAPHVSMWAVLRASFLKPLLSATGFAVCGDILGFVPPLCLEFMVDFVTDKQGADGDSVGWARGYWLVAATVAALVVQNLCWERHLHAVLRTGMRAQLGVMGAVYGKALRLSTEARNATSVGQITNLYNGDALQLRKTVVRLSALVSAPLIITVSLVLLYRQLGAATFVGFLVLAVLTPLQIRMGKRLKKLQKRTLKYSDKRLKLINEIVQVRSGGGQWW